MKQLGPKVDVMRCDVRLCIARRSRIFQNEGIVEDGLGLCESVARTSPRHLATREVEVETDSGSCRQEIICVFVSFLACA